MTVNQKYRIKGDQLIIDLPKELKSSGKEILVTIENVSELKMEKMELMKKAATDPLFLKDIKNLSVDFENNDLE
ncbi:hypothetical protein SAMN03080617_01577 [Algoriphagus alkaliphilus]|uniref:Uncharacterized protein n=1 Tax=Algoriphagus alkaliphilus TaxID=279824 RepID=A0A1G5XA12_9BACT|nr:hypothetical protein [Algoriphagus alkaliphilus]MBA4298930.1 hypothetical protein [Cyclobacterium sp.]SDA66395.1 hypothetical protein SAMN03080617_01577 [Algoriphagus alkaliphilus]